uniref:HARE-HTH domain-containing protein n=1 Tax=Caenorhabditis tropicalis TaxID=1561998 RepID=A0A1I7TGY7_9PELO
MADNLDTKIIDLLAEGVANGKAQQAAEVAIKLLKQRNRDTVQVFPKKEKKLETPTPEEKIYSEHYHLRLYIKCVRKYQKFCEICWRLERHTRFSRYPERISREEQEKLLKPMSVPELNQFLKDLQPKLDDVFDQQCDHFPQYVFINFYEWKEPFENLWYVIRKRCGSVKDRVKGVFGSSEAVVDDLKT